MKLTLLLLMLIAHSCYAAQQVVLMNKPTSALDARNNYAKELLIAVLSSNEAQYGSAIVKHSIPMNNERAKILMIKDNYGDVIYAVTKKIWEDDLIPIRVPLFKGMNGMRVFLINKDMQSTFSKINTLQELKKIPLGAGHIWSITKTLKEAGFSVVTAPNYHSLFAMLEKNRFAYIPRAINEILPEYQIRKKDNPNLKIEESILLKTTLPAYFFVSPHKPLLAKRISEGVSLIIADGTFDRIFLKHYGDTFNELNVHKRKVILMPNDALHEQTPLGDKSLWLDITLPITEQSFTKH